MLHCLILLQLDSVSLDAVDAGCPLCYQTLQRLVTIAGVDDDSSFDSHIDLIDVHPETLVPCAD